MESVSWWTAGVTRSVNACVPCWLVLQGQLMPVYPDGQLVLHGQLMPVYPDGQLVLHGLLMPVYPDGECTLMDSWCYMVC